MKSIFGDLWGIHFQQVPLLKCMPSLSSLFVTPVGGMCVSHRCWDARTNPIAGFPTERWQPILERVLHVRGFSSGLSVHDKNVNLLPRCNCWPVKWRNVSKLTYQILSNWSLYLLCSYDWWFLVFSLCCCFIVFLKRICNNPHNLYVWKETNGGVEYLCQNSRKNLWMEMSGCVVDNSS